MAFDVRRLSMRCESRHLRSVRGAGAGAAFEIGRYRVMDNLSSHKRARVRELIEAAGAELCFQRRTRLM